MDTPKALAYPNLNNNSSRTPCSAADAMSHPCVVATKGDHETFQAIEAIGLKLLVVDPVASDAAGVTLAVNGEEIFLIEAPMLCVGFFASRSESLQTLEAVRKRFELWSGMAFPAPILVDRFDALHLVLASTLVRQTHAIAAHATRLARELFHLRSDHEVLQNNFAVAEALITAHQFAQAQLRFENPPTMTSTGAGRREIHQLLPVSSSGLIGIDLHLSEFAEAATHAGILVRLSALEDHVDQASWSIEAAQCQAGWVSLDLPAAWSGLARTPQITIATAGGFGTLPQLSLGVPQPLPRFRAVADDTTLPGSLALRCWSGQPGTRASHEVSFPPKLGETGSVVTDMLFPASLRATAKCVSSGWMIDRNIVLDRPKENGVFLHPPPADVVPNMTVGVIEGLTVDRPIRITAKGVVGSEKAAPGEFALAAAPAGFDGLPRLADALRGTHGDLCFSGWTEGSFGHDAFVSVFIPPSSLPQQLYLATRMAHGASNDFGWLSLDDLRITFLGPTDEGR